MFLVIFITLKKKNGSAHNRVRVNGLVMDPNLNPIYQTPLINITDIL